MGLLLLRGKPRGTQKDKYKGKSKVSRWLTVVKPIKNLNSDAEKVLFHNGAMSAIWHSTEIKANYNQKINEGKCRKVTKVL